MLTLIPLCTLLQVPPGIKKEIVQNLRYLNIVVVYSLITASFLSFVRAAFENQTFGGMIYLPTG